VTGRVCSLSHAMEHLRLLRHCGLECGEKDSGMHKGKLPKTGVLIFPDKPANDVLTKM